MSQQNTSVNEIISYSRKYNSHSQQYQKANFRIQLHMASQQHCVNGTQQNDGYLAHLNSETAGLKLQVQGTHIAAINTTYF